MYHHEPAGWICPFCQLARGEETSLSGQADLIHRDAEVIAFMSIDGMEGHEGHVLVVPVAHYENVFDLPPELGAPLQRVVRRVARAMKAAYRCDGISVLQNNEPGGGQDVWHYHAHVFPRYAGDRFRRAPWARMPASERRARAAMLREAMAALDIDDAPV